ncbi:DUF3298 domain-containing protein [Acinetobacter sp. MD2]|nr:DUF3298 domain-containing protein [Acinetobacter sp. MD2]
MLLVGTLCLGLLAGCQPASTSKDKDQTAAQDASDVATIAHTPLITAQTIPIKLAHSIVCESDECTNYDLQTVHSNVDWIDAYFLKRLQTDSPLAFKPPVQVASEPNPNAVNQSQYQVRYLGQNDRLASFVLDSSTYNAGAAHGMYHADYVVFDLKTKQRIMVDQLFQDGKQQQVIDALYESNQQWLTEHQISKDKLQLSDNFYYGVHGIVFVYPLYEIASYADGMPELTLPYRLAGELVKTEYLPH